MLNIYKKLGMPLDNKYFAEKMRESRLRRKQTDKTFYKKYLFTIDINGQKYVFRSKQDIKIDRIDKKDVLPEYIKTF